METWILAGQSNMEGRGLLNDPRATVEPMAQVRALNSAGDWEVAADPLHRPWESFTPIHRELARGKLERNEPHLAHLTDAELAARERRHGTVGAGLGVAFGQALAAAKGTEIGLIPVAHGGTAMTEWTVGPVPNGGRTLFGSLFERVALARTSAPVELGGILWYQGESDGTAADFACYAKEFDTWVAAVREVLDAPALPVYVVQLGRTVRTELEALEPFDPEDPPWTEEGWDAIREAQRTASVRLPHVGVVSAIDLGLVDHCHVDAAGLVRLGRRLARLALTGGVSPDVVRVERAPDAGNGRHRLRIVCAGVEGGWRPADHITGFELRDGANRRHRAVGVVDAHPDPDDPRNITVILTSEGEFDPRLRIGYGLGFDPPCLAVDAADMPLPAFAAQPVGPAQKCSRTLPN